MAVSINWGSFCGCRYYQSLSIAPDFWKLPNHGLGPVQGGSSQDSDGEPSVRLIFLMFHLKTSPCMPSLSFKPFEKEWTDWVRSSFKGALTIRRD